MHRTFLTFLRALLMIGLVMALFPISPPTIASPIDAAIQSVSANESRASGRIAMPSTGLWFNAGGGVLTDGTDGMKFVFHCGGNGSEQVWFTGKENYYNGSCSSTGFNMKVGGTNYGSQSNPWTSIDIREIAGSATLTAGTAKGDGYAVIDYTATVGGYTYNLAREISYTYPNQYFSESISSPFLQMRLRKRSHLQKVETRCRAVPTEA